jgi:hypothetical protein
MKSYQTLLIFGLSLAACKKESPVQSLTNASSQQDAVTSGSNACLEFDPSDFVKGIDNRYLPLFPVLHLHYVNSSVDDGSLLYRMMT